MLKPNVSPTTLPCIQRIRTFLIGTLQFKSENLAQNGGQVLNRESFHDSIHDSRLDPRINLLIKIQYSTIAVLVITYIFMIKISKLADYSLVILQCLTRLAPGFYSAALLAERTGLATPTVSKVLKLLNEAQVVVSTRGVSGGYKLAKNPDQINLVDIIKAIDGAPALMECCEPNSQCIHDHHCQMRNHWQFINRVVVKALSQFTLLDLQHGEVNVR